MHGLNPHHPIGVDQDRPGRLGHPVEGERVDQMAVEAIAKNRFGQGKNGLHKVWGGVAQAIERHSVGNAFRLNLGDAIKLVQDLMAEQ